MKKSTLHAEHTIDLLYQALETEKGGLEIYEHALACAIHPDLKKEWQGYLEETKKHNAVLLRVFDALNLDPNASTPGREVVAALGKAFVQAIDKAKASGNAKSAELVAAECIVLAETKDHLNWELIGQVAKHGNAQEKKILSEAFEEVFSDENHHLFHNKGWARELWIDALGFPAVLPPPEEVRHVETAIGASRAEQARDKMLD